MRLCTNVNYPRVKWQNTHGRVCIYRPWPVILKPESFCTNEYHPTLSYQLADYVRIPAGNPAYNSIAVYSPCVCDLTGCNRNGEIPATITRGNGRRPAACIYLLSGDGTALGEMGCNACSRSSVAEAEDARKPALTGRPAGAYEPLILVAG